MKIFLRLFILCIVICTIIFIAFNFIISNQKKKNYTRMALEHEVSGINKIAYSIKKNNKYVDLYQLYINGDMDIKAFISRRDPKSEAFVDKWQITRGDVVIPKDIFEQLCIFETEYDANKSEVRIWNKIDPTLVKKVMLKK